MNEAAAVRRQGRRVRKLVTVVAVLRRRAAEIESWTEWIYPHRSLRFTREGWFFLVITIAIGLAALNTGHNLFYLIFAMLVSLIVVSGLLSERALRSLAIERSLPADVFAGSAVPIELRVRNESARRASYAVEIRDGIAGEARRRVGFIDRLDPGAERAFVALWTFPKRGRAAFRSLHLVTRFPFGLFEKSRIVRTKDDCLVYPPVRQAGAMRSSRGTGDEAFRKHRLGEEIVGLRRMLEDDDPRRIHWRVSARTGEWMVTEHAETLDRPLVLFFDNRGPAGAAFEAAVEDAASLVWHMSRSAGTPQFFSWGVSFGEDGVRAARAVLEFLAEVVPAPGGAETGEASLVAWRRAVDRTGGGIFVTTVEPPELPSGTLLRVA